MTKFGKSIMVTFAISTLIAGLTGCKKNEGSLERAGEEVKKAAEKAGQQIEEAGEKIQDAAKDAAK